MGVHRTHVKSGCWPCPTACLPPGLPVGRSCLGACPQSPVSLVRGRRRGGCVTDKEMEAQGGEGLARTHGPGGPGWALELSQLQRPPSVHGLKRVSWEGCDAPSSATMALLTLN